MPDLALPLSLSPAVLRGRWPRRSHCPRASLGRRWSQPLTTRTSRVEEELDRAPQWVGHWLEGHGYGRVDGILMWEVTSGCGRGLC